MKKTVSRRAVLGVGAAGLAGLTAPAISRGAEAAVLRMVPQEDLAVLDPLQTSSAATQNHAYTIYDTLYAEDAHQRPLPQMAERHDVSPDGRVWRITLRDGLCFHDGEPVLARDCAASLARWSKRDTFGRMLGQIVDAWDTQDDRTIRIALKRPFPHLLNALAKPSWVVPFMMPARIAATDPFKPVTEYVGSGPYRYLADEHVSGDRVVYARFDRYVPRQETPERAAGGKVAHFDRVEWRVIPDPSTAAAALQSGEVDWWEQAQNDLLPLLRRDRNMTVQVYNPAGQLQLLRFNVTQPPFDNVALRRALLLAIDQRDYLRAIAGDDDEGARTCFSQFPCTLPIGSEKEGQALAGLRNLDAARKAIQDAGYKGERIVILNAIDSVLLRPQGAITLDLFKRLGLNAELIETDYNTMIAKRKNRGPVEQGGWSVFHTWWGGLTIANPVLNVDVRGQGAEGYDGWYSSPHVEELVAEWLDTTDDAKQAAIVDEILQDSFTNVPTIPLGMTFVRTAFRRQITGVLPGNVPYPWNVRRAA